MYNIPMQQKITYAGVAAGLCLLAGMNLFVSQRFPSLMYRLVSLKDKKAAQEFILGLQNNKISRQQTAYFSDIFSSLEKNDDVSPTETEDVAQKIAHYEKLLSYNRKNPLVLAHLAQLYEKKGDQQKTKQLYNEAKKIDPWIKL